MAGRKKIEHDMNEESSLERLEKEYNEDKESIFEKYSSQDYDFYDEDNAGYDDWSDNNYGY